MRINSPFLVIVMNYREEWHFRTWPGKCNCLNRSRSRSAPVGLPVAGGRREVRQSVWRKSEDQENMDTPFEPEASSDSFAAADLKLADPLSSGLFFTATDFHGRNRSTA